MTGLTVFDKMDYAGIQPIEAFRSSLKQETASKEDYGHVINVYATFNWERLYCSLFEMRVVVIV